MGRAIILKFKSFCLGSVSKSFTKGEQSQISLNSTVYDFLVDHSSTKHEDIPKMPQFLLINDNIKSRLGLLKYIYWIIS